MPHGCRNVDNDCWEDTSRRRRPDGRVAKPSTTIRCAADRRRRYFFVARCKAGVDPEARQRNFGKSGFVSGRNAKKRP
jgi:hypothetical protein